MFDALISEIVNNRPITVRVNHINYVLVLLFLWLIKTGLQNHIVQRILFYQVRDDTFGKFAISLAKQLNQTFLSVVGKLFIDKQHRES